jgi:hypothetical protein
VDSLVRSHRGYRDTAIEAARFLQQRQPGAKILVTDLRDPVADIAAGCTGSVTIPKPPWRPGKETYIDHVRTASPSIRLVSASDKLHNARAILRDYRRIGDELWSRFTGAGVAAGGSEVRRPGTGRGGQEAREAGAGQDRLIQAGAAGDRGIKAPAVNLVTPATRTSADPASRSAAGPTTYRDVLP